MDRFRKQVVLASTTIVLVIVLGALTGLSALRASVSQHDQARAIDEHVVLIEKLRDTTREVTSSARRYMITGDHKEQLRIHALFDDLAKDRARLDARYTLTYGPVLEADLDAYQLGVASAIAAFEADPVERLTRFEDQLARVRVPLAARFDDLIARERSTREKLRSAQTLARSAQWTLVLASCIGVMLAIGLCIAVVRRPLERATDGPRGEPPARTEQPSEPAVLR